MRPDEELNALSLPQLFERLARTGLVDRLLALAADEDLGVDPARARLGVSRTGLGGAGDVTTDACIAPHRRATAVLVARAPGVISGMACLTRLLSVFAPGVDAHVHVRDGASVDAHATIATLRGPLDEMLSLERTLLNIVGRLSGVATLTSRYVRAVEGTRAKVCDTRKTTPGMRVLEKYAVRCGGGCCHRVGLFDAVLIKDNHLAGVATGELASFVTDAARRARAQHRQLSFVEVEVDSLEQLGALLGVARGVIDIVLLDNMSVERLSRAVAMRDERAPWIELEASGGVTLETIGSIARTGVDRISVGALTHSAPALDVALDVTEVA